MPPEYLFWGGLLLAGTAYEAAAIRQRHFNRTLSDVTRDVFHTRTSKWGPIVFIATWGSFATWFAHHILTK
jgi:hypothetical protein